MYIELQLTHAAVRRVKRKLFKLWVRLIASAIHCNSEIGVQIAFHSW